MLYAEAKIIDENKCGKPNIVLTINLMHSLRNLREKGIQLRGDETKEELAQYGFWPETVDLITNDPYTDFVEKS